ncbi:MAG: acyltransferase family protein [Eubacterium sp.]|jgi:acyltransferase 3|uniref:acyltransferase family protein n=1 Tax=Eubacterium sp. TaxID=142586 RepID=UPI003993C380
MYIIKDILSQQIVPMAIICIVLGICILPLRKNDKFSKQGLEIENMTIIKSLACIMVIVSHLCAQMEGIGILALPANVGFLAVGMFFFCSGYGLTYSYINKENYIQHFLKRRLLCILIPFWSANIIYIVLEQKN